MKFRILLLLLLCQWTASAGADPAPWYQWRSKLDGKVFCAQTSPGAGWEKLAPPFRDARCEHPYRHMH